VEDGVIKRRHWKQPLIVGYLFLTLSPGLVEPAAAQESDTAAAPRYFGGHQFIPSTIVPDPFISTTFMSTTGFGKAINLITPVYNVDGEQISEISSDIGFMVLGFDYQQALSHRVALHAALSASARVGTSPEAILSEGLSAIYGYSLGGMVNVVQKRNWQLSATADLRGNTLYSVAPLDFALAVVDNVENGDSTGAVQDAQDSLLASGDNLRVLGGVRGAYTPAPGIGFISFLEAGLGEKFEKGSDNTSVVNFGAAASFDFNPLTRTPVGLLATFRNESLSEKGDDVGSVQSYGLGIFYTGRRFFTLGLENTWSQLSQHRTDKKIDVAQARIVLRYDFK
jgi:hypothetical protein